MAITIIARGTGTLPVSYNTISTVVVSAAAATAGDTVLITATSAFPGDIKYEHSMYVSDADGDGFTVSSSYPDVPVAITFGYVILTGTAWGDEIIWQ